MAVAVAVTDGSLKDLKDVIIGTILTANTDIG